MNVLSFESVAESLGLPPDLGHTLELAEAEPSPVYLVKNQEGTEYLLLCVRRDPDADRLRDLMQKSKTITAAIVLCDDGTISKAFKKNLRTGDIDAAASPQESRSNFWGFHATSRHSETGLVHLRRLTAKLENVLFEVHSAARDIDGLHAPDALDEICKLLYAKLYDEESAPATGRHRFQRAAYSSIEECAASIRRLYHDAVKDDEAVFSNRIPSYSRSRGVFRDPITLSSQATFKCVSLMEGYDFGGSAVDIKGRAFQNVLIPATRAGMGQYFTPAAIIELCIRLLNPSVRDVVVDPFCGSGHFLTAALDHVRKQRPNPDKQFHAFAFTRLHGLEKSDRMVRIAMTDMRLHGDGHSNIRCVDSLLPFASYPDLHEETFDIVATNPPFGVDIPEEAISELGPFAVLKRRRGRPAATSLEILALDRCISLLRPGGRMAIVLPDGILGNRGAAFVREWLLEEAMIRAIVSLPIETFTPFGANIKTSVLLLRKYLPGEKRTPYNIFLANVKSIGHDSGGRPAASDDFDQLERQFREFIEREGW